MPGTRHSDGERPNRGWTYALLALLVLGWLNLWPGKRGSRAFEEQSNSGFEASRGWPFRSWTRANDEGADLVRTSMVHGSVRCWPDRFAGSAFPHLCIDPWFAALDVLVALAFLRVAFVAGRPPRRPA